MRGYWIAALLSLCCVKGGEASASEPEKYTPKDFSYLKGTRGFSDALLDMHFTLYRGYVKNVNILMDELSALSASSSSVLYAEVKRRFAWEFDGMRWHELYFENLGPARAITQKGELFTLIVKEFGSFEAWKKDFIATGLMRGIGWVVLCYDRQNQRIFNAWIAEHQTGLLAQAAPLLVMDVWEHAFITEYGLDRQKYVNSFFDAINWGVVESRLKGCL